MMAENLPWAPQKMVNFCILKKSFEEIVHLRLFKGFFFFIAKLFHSNHSGKIDYKPTKIIS